VAKTVRESGATHLSTWMLIQDDSEFIAKMSGFAKDDALPMSLKLRIQGDEKSIDLYSNMTVNDFLGLVGALAEVPTQELKITMVEETRLSRIDT